MPYKVTTRKRKIRQVALVPYGGSRMVAKRRRLVTRNRRRSSVITQTTRQLRGSNPFAFRGRKLSRKAYRIALFNATRFKTHFRSVFASSDALGTPNNVVDCSPYAVRALTGAATLEFWRTAGGLQDPSFGEVPAWATLATADPITIILRGGRLFLTTSLPLGSVDAVKVRVQLIFCRQQRRNVGDTAFSTTIGEPGVAGGWLGTTGINLNGPGYGAGAVRPLGWDIMQAPDAAQYLFRPVLDRSFDLKAGDSMSTFWKIKPYKMDVGIFKDDGGYAPMWFVYVTQDNNSNALSETVTVVAGHNLAFSVGDTLT